METLIRKRPLLAYYALTFAFSWGGFLLVVGAGSLVNTNWQAEGKFLAAVLVMLAGNPPVTGEPTWDSSATRALAKQACFDCHSNETQWPAYSSVAPASWLVQRDVNDGRAVLNFSEWTRPQEEAKEASETVREGEMPPDAYTLMHAHARLKTEDRDRLARGFAKTLGSTPQQEADGRER
jgi:mono/diheme cytochrome c family protein